MCLDRLIDIDIGDSGEGYKVFKRTTGGRIIPMYYNFKIEYQSNKKLLPKRRWLVSRIEKYLKCECSFDCYLSGFHVYLDKEKVLSMRYIGSIKAKTVIHRVLWKDKIITGLDSGIKTVVARQIFIMEEVERS
jgi:hypothetical protein